MPPVYSGFKPLVGGGPQHPTARVGATRGGLTATATVSAMAAADTSDSKSGDAALRSTFVDKEEAAMLRAMARLNGDDPAKKVGNSFSRSNRLRIAARSQEAAALGLVPLDPKEQHELNRKMQAGYTKISERGIRVPKVGQRAMPQRPAPVECLVHRRTEEEIRYANDNFEVPQAPPGVPTKSSDEKKDELALRHQFNGRTPQEIIAAHGGPRSKLSPPRERTLREQITDEIAGIRAAARNPQLASFSPFRPRSYLPLTADWMRHTCEQSGRSSSTKCGLSGEAPSMRT